MLSWRCSRTGFHSTAIPSCSPRRSSTRAGSRTSSVLAPWTGPAADAYRRHGLRYYPKLLGAVPFTPVPGPRLLIATRALVATGSYEGGVTRNITQQLTYASSDPTVAAAPPLSNPRHKRRWSWT